MLFVTFLFAGCNENTVISIEIDESNYEEEVNIEDFDLSDISLIVKMSDGTTKTITLTEDMLSSADLALLETVGTHTVTVNAMGQTVELSITLTETVEPMWVIYQLALASGTVDSTYEEWLDTIKGQDGKEVTFTVEDGWIKWKYQVIRLGII